jgi:hypothetical protein
MGNNDLFDISKLDEMNSNPVTDQINETFKKVIKEKTKVISNVELNNFKDSEEPSLNSDGEIELGLELSSGENPSSMTLESTHEATQNSNSFDDGFEIDLSESSGVDLSQAVSGQDIQDSGVDELFGDLPIKMDHSEESLSLSDAPVEAVTDQETDFSELDFVTVSETAEKETQDSNDILTLNDLGLDPDIPDLGESDTTSNHEHVMLDSHEFKVHQGPGIEEEMSDDARRKLEEIDEIMVEDATRVKQQNLNGEKSLSQDIFSLQEIENQHEENLPKERNDAGSDEIKDLKEFKDIAYAYSGEMERIQATLSNLRSDREELLLKIYQLEEDKVIQSRQILSQRAEIDERKIELTIIRKKLHEEINNLKDSLIVQEERRLILEEKNRILNLELDKSKQKNKIDIKHVQMREKELEQKLELLKSDAETQIRNRDLKILELKRKIDAMEFDMESISSKEKKSIESRFELEDKLDKAIKTLRSAISALEDEGNRSDAMKILKKNIDI